MEDNKPWYQDLPEDSEVFFEKCVKRIYEAVRTEGAGFEKAAEGVCTKNAKVRENILDTALKVIIAELHFVGKQDIKGIAKKLQLPQERLTKARDEMLKDVEAAAIEQAKAERNIQGNA